MQTRLVYASSGEAIAFFEDRNVFTMEGVWAGFSPDHSTIYDVNGKYIGLYLTDGRIAIDPRKPLLPPIAAPKQAVAKALPYTIPIRPPLPRLPAPYEEAVLMSSDSGSRQVRFSAITLIVVISIIGFVAYLVVNLVKFGQGEITSLTSGSDKALILISALFVLTIGYALKWKVDKLTTKLVAVLVVGTKEKRAIAIRFLRNIDPSIPVVEVDSDINPYGVLDPLVRSLTQNKRAEFVIFANALELESGNYAPTFSFAGASSEQNSIIVDIPKFAERCHGRILLTPATDYKAIESAANSFGAIFQKRLFDIVVSSSLLLLCLPVMFITTLLIFIESGRPITYRQERVGLNGKIIRILKFRTVKTTIDGDGKPIWALAADDRLTRIGRVIRRLRIDELPQLLNVLKGDLSIVGPRPERPFFVEQLQKEIPYYVLRNLVKPGITGWSQVRYQFGAMIENTGTRLEYDLFYVKNHSVILDILITLETVSVVMVGNQYARY